MRKDCPGITRIIILPINTSKSVMVGGSHFGMHALQMMRPIHRWRAGHQAVHLSIVLLVLLVFNLQSHSLLWQLFYAGCAMASPGYCSLASSNRFLDLLAPSIPPDRYLSTLVPTTSITQKQLSHLKFQFRSHHETHSIRHHKLHSRYLLIRSAFRV